MKWINILHLYQPPTQTREIVDIVSRESYNKIISLLDRYPDLRLTVNISGSLLELLAKYGHEDIIAGFKKHAKRGAVELLASAMYHPILPLLKEKEISRQIRLNNEISKKYFGDCYDPKGFYFPEMAYSREAARAVTGAGFKWTVLDEIHTTEKIDPEKRYAAADAGLGVIFRNSLYSRTFPPESLFKDADKMTGKYIITCHDGELYGHWHKDDRGYYDKAFGHGGIATATAGEYLGSLGGEVTEISVRDASWESKPEELERNISLGLWNDPRNDIHNLLENFKREVLTLVENHQSDPSYEKARHYADRGVASCAWWWASERKLGPFSPVSWNPTEIEKGARELHTAAASLSVISADNKAKITFLFENLRKAIWTKHKEKYDPNYLVE